MIRAGSKLCARRSRGGRFALRMLAAGALGLAAAPCFAGVAPGDTALSVNGDPVTVRELVEAQQRWRFKTEDPVLLQKIAVEDCVRFKIMEQMARRYGLLQDISDEGLRTTFRRENERRARVLAVGGVIYGPRQFAWEPFRMYWLDGLRRQLEDRMGGVGGPDSADTPADLKRREDRLELAIGQAMAAADIRIIKRPD